MNEFSGWGGLESERGGAARRTKYWRKQAHVFGLGRGFRAGAGMFSGWGERGGAGAAGGGRQKYLDAGGRAAEAPHFSEFYFKNNVMAVLFCPGTEKRDLIYLLKYEEL